MSSLSLLDDGSLAGASRPAVTATEPGWPAGLPRAAFEASQIVACLQQVREPVHIIAAPDGARRGLALDSQAGNPGNQAAGLQLGTLPPLYPEWLGDRDFGEAHGVRFPYVAGEMARGIATTRMVIAMARAEMLGIFGAAGLDIATIERAVHELTAALGGAIAPGAST